MDIQKVLHVNISGSTTSGPLAHVPIPATPCSGFPRDQLWNRSQPTGFMYNNTWRLYHCRGIPVEKKLNCLQNLKVLLIGDSTIRYWFRYILKAWNCTLMSEKWHYAAWKRRSLCQNPQLNLTVEWLPHAQPFYGVPDTVRYTRASICRHLEEIGSDVTVTVVLNLYLHVINYHHSVFRDRIRRIRKCVENLLNRNSNVKIFIQAPHTFNDDAPRQTDFYAELFISILHEEFKGLYDKVTYLDHKDITVATNNRDIHPNDIVVGAMVDQLLAYTCEI